MTFEKLTLILHTGKSNRQQPPDGVEVERNGGCVEKEVSCLKVLRWLPFPRDLLVLPDGAVVLAV